MSPPIRRIAHLDMDAFFASVMLLRFPQLKNEAVVMGGPRRSNAGTNNSFGDDLRAKACTTHPDQDWADVPDHELPLRLFPRLKGYTGRGVITTATYAARRFGVGSAMGLMKAAKRCPEAYLMPVDFDEVRRCSHAFKAVISELAPIMEDRGIDEVYIDFTEVPGGQREGGRVLARLIQKTILERTGLHCSIGVAPNKLLAKMASEFNKPAGISIVHEDDLAAMIWPLPCRKINGIGPKADARLQTMGIHTIGELAQQNPSALMAAFGTHFGQWLHDAAWGRDERPVVTYHEPVSMSRETTFERDLHAVQDREALSRIFTRLCEQVAADLQRKGYVGRTIGIKLRFDNFKSVTRDQTVPQATQDASMIRQQAGLCLKRVDLSRKLRLLGVRVGQLSKAGELDLIEANPVNLDLFEL